MQFSELTGMKLAKVSVADDQVEFLTIENRKFLLHHDQDCCESVSIEDICGDVSDLIGEPILLAEESTSNEHPAGLDRPADSFTWTFYKLSTIKGSVTIRWFGESNGYYSESVDFDEVGVAG